jgi:hypothetical protein
MRKVYKDNFFLNIELYFTMIKNSKIEVSLLIGSLFYFTARLRQTDFRKKIC